MKKITQKICIIFLILLNSISAVSQCWKQVSAGNNFTLAIKNDGTLWAWGRVQGSYGNNESPIQIGTDTDWKIAEAASQYSLVIKNNGTLWGWGKNPLGQLGNGTQTDVMIISQIGTDNDWESVSAYITTLALKTDGSLWAWGSNEWGQAGVGSNSYLVLTPTRVGNVTDKWKSFSTFNASSAAIKTDGTLWSWGVYYPRIPTQNTTSNDWKKVISGAAHHLALKTDGTLWSWGDNFFGQLGLGTTTNTQIITQIGSDTNWKAISAGYFCSFAQKTDNTVWSWGLNPGGVLGYGYVGGSHLIPGQVAITTDLKSFDAGDDHIMYLKNDDSLWVCGSDYFGQLGVGATLYSQSTPIAIACTTSLGINDIADIEVAIYPNPTTGIVTISNQDNLIIDKIEIVDIIGKTVSTKTENTFQIDMSEFSKGIYILKIHSGETILQKKIIKE